MTAEGGALQPPGAAIISVGDELLLGQTVDTNGTWIARELSDLGLIVRGRWVVGDEREAILQALREASEKAEVVVVTGGLGPTPDDRTRETVAEYAGATLTLDPTILQRLESRFRARGYETLPEGSCAMAQVPEGGEVLLNPHGAAPGLVIPADDRRVLVLLPGVPKEMKGILEEGVKPLLAKRFSDRLQAAHHRVIHTFGVPESVLMGEVQSLLPEDLDGVTVAYLPDPVSVRLRLTVRATGEPEEEERRLQQVEEVLEPVLSRYRYQADSGDLAEAVGTALVERGHTLAVAESCTGGLLAKRITSIPGSSRFFLGGVVAYANVVKEGLLGIEPTLLEETGAVSEEVAAAMATGVARELGASLGVGITGIAGPGGGTPEKPVGTVCLAVSTEDATTTRREQFLGDREAVRERATHATLGLILRTMWGREG